MKCTRNHVLTSFFSLLGASSIALAAEPPLEVEVLFTDPTCPAQTFVSYRDPNIDDTYQLYLEDQLAAEDEVRFDDLPGRIETLADGIPTLNGGRRLQIPAGVYCDANDKEASIKPATESAVRDQDSPYLRVMQWLEQTQRDESVFLTSMSFSDRDVATALCDGAKRGVNTKVFIQEPRSENTAFRTISSCLSESGDNLIDLVIYPRSKNRLAHMKAIVIESASTRQEEASEVRISFQSANISTGLWGHQENWNFVTTRSDHWFAQDHFCLRDEITRPQVDDLNLFYRAMANCRERLGIEPRRQQDDNVQLYFVPISSNRGFHDKRSLRRDLEEEIARSKHIKIAAHHLTDRWLLDTLADKLQLPGFTLDIIVDDDMFWTSFTPRHSPFIDEGNRRYFKPSDYSRNCQWGKTRAESEDCFSFFNRGEWFAINEKLISNGANIRYFEANHRNFLLFHHKFIIFDYQQPVNDKLGSVFTGAGNLSKSGFDRNFENYYLLRLPEVYQAFTKGYANLFNLAVEEGDLPITWDFETVDQVN